MLRRLTRKCKYFVDGMRRAGFTRGCMTVTLFGVCVFPHGAFLVEGV